MAVIAGIAIAGLAVVVGIPVGICACKKKHATSQFAAAWTAAQDQSTSSSTREEGSISIAMQARSGGESVINPLR